MFDYQALIKQAEKDAVRGCGCSDVLYEANRQRLFADILASAPPEFRDKTEEALLYRGFEPEFTPFQPMEGECGLTGISEDCCPCGRHE